MNFFKRFAVAILALCALHGPAFAQDVQLTSRDGTIKIDGTLLGYDGEFYRVDTEYGPLTVDGQGVDCAGPGCPDLNSYVAEVTFSGTRQMADVLIPALIQAFADRKKLRLLREVKDDTNSTFVLSDDQRVRAKFVLRAGTTSEGFADLISEQADIALVLREPRETELQRATENGLGNLTKGRRARVIALDGIVAITASSQPVDRMSLEQLAAVFSGQINNWADLGGTEFPLERHIPLPDTGLAEAFEDRVVNLSDSDLELQGMLHAAPEELADTVAGDSVALGLTTLTQVGNAKAVRLSGSCGFEQEATVQALRSEDYPLTLPLMLYTPARRLPLMAREFLSYAESPAADIVIRRAGFVDQSITSSDFNSQGDRLAYAISRAGDEVPLSQLQRLVNVLRDRDRLSTTFRFKGGARELDVQSRENIARLALALETRAFDGKELTFVGFSDGEGDPTANLKLSADRAATVMEEVRDAAPAADFANITLRVEAFGEALPMACDDTEWGRAINRRVEVWVK